MPMSWKQLSKPLFIAAIGALLVLYWFGWIKNAGPFDIAVLVALLGGYRIFGDAVWRLLHREISSDLAIAVAACAALAIGQYFAAAEVIFIMLVGGWLEELAVDRTRGAIAKLIRLAPRSARVRRGDAWVDTALADIRPGDLVEVRPGERIAVDGEVAGGSSSVDQSAITGESIPAGKTTGDKVFAGTINQVGSLDVRVTAVGEDSTLGRIIHLVEEAEEKKAVVHQRADRWAVWFVPTVLALGLATFLFSGGDFGARLLRAVSVLIVACPCALALAAPFALGMAQRLLARMQVFVKNALVIERMAQVEAIVFDKTGTLTAGSAEAVAFRGNEEYRMKNAERGQNRLIGQSLLTSAATGGRLSAVEEGWVWAVARHSTHPQAVRIGQSLAGAATAGAVEDFTETPGAGIAGRVQGHEVRLGSRVWLESWGIPIDEYVSQRLEEGSVVCLAIDGELRGQFVLANAVRPETDELLRGLSGRYDLALLSGDNERERERFRSLFGKDAGLHFNQSPLDKLGFIRRLQESGQTVMMVGDGLNDAGALKQSDVGVAVIEKVGAFSPASDVILAASQVRRLSRILDMARRTTQIVRLSFGISFLYNILGIGIAAAGILSPVICAILMPLSSVSVVLFACGATRMAAQRAGLTK